RHRDIDHPEIELGGLAQQFLQPGGILQSRDLHQNAVSALALDQRFNRAELVDAPLNDLNRLLDRLANPLEDSRVRHGETRRTAGLGRYVEATLASHAPRTPTD